MIGIIYINITILYTLNSDKHYRNNTVWLISVLLQFRIYKLIIRGDMSKFNIFCESVC